MKNRSQNRMSASIVASLAACAFPEVHPAGGATKRANAIAPEPEGARQERPSATRAPNSLLASIASLTNSAAASVRAEPAAMGVVADPASVTGPAARSAQGDTTDAADAEASAGSNGPLDHLSWQPPMARRRPGATQALLGLLGHNQECITLAMSGRIAACDCNTRPMEDPAVAVGLVMHYARTAMTRRLPIPPVVLELLTQRVEEDDPTCIMVAKWLDDSGLLDITYKDDAAGRVQ